MNIWIVCFSDVFMHLAFSSAEKAKDYVLRSMKIDLCKEHYKQAAESLEKSYNENKNNFNAKYDTDMEYACIVKSPLNFDQYLTIDEYDEMLRKIG